MINKETTKEINRTLTYHYCRLKKKTFLKVANFYMPAFVEPQSQLTYVLKVLRMKPEAI